MEQQQSFPIFGSEATLIVDAEPVLARAALVNAEELLRTLQKQWTRFERDSLLSRLNASAEPSLKVSRELALLVAAARWAADFSDGLVDPCVIDALESNGYQHSRAGLEAASLGDAIREAPERQPAAVSTSSRWREISVDTENSVVSRPPGIRIDSGGSGKGLAADLLARRLASFPGFVAAIGGDIRMGGSKPPERAVSIENPFRREKRLGQFPMREGAVATSGIAGRLWQDEKGFAHHLIDPSSGEPAWTGVVQATAIANSALKAETLAKMALLAGPERGCDILSEHGGVVVLDNGEARIINIPDYAPEGNEVSE